MAKLVVKTLHGVRFEWDETKAAANPLRHDGVTFDEATEVFFDVGARWVDASRNNESRMAVIGYGASERLLFVVHVEIADEGFRIISARRASSIERRVYES
jgi:uncharacterized DUF497 family protein